MTDYIANINEYPIGGNNFDCEWVTVPLMLADAVTYSATSKTTYDLSNYLPNDNYTYMVAFSGWGRTPSGSGSATIRVMTGTQTYADTVAYGCRMMVTEYHSTSTYICSGNLMIPIYSNDRNVTVANSSANATGSCGFYAIAYRRLGTNT